MAAVRQESTYVCIKENFSFNKHFLVGDGFPEEWLRNGYTPNQHFAKAAIAYDEIERVKQERAMYGHGDDARSTKELRELLGEYIKTIPQDWTRKKIWLELRRHEAASAMDDSPGPPSRPPGRPPKKG
jgi:hypothetical protein